MNYQPSPNSFVRASIAHIKTVQPSDGPDDFHSGPEYDLYVVNVEHGPRSSFLEWFHQRNAYGLCQVGDTSKFVDVGVASIPSDLVIDMTFDEFFPQWLDTAASIAKAEITRMAEIALSGVQ